MERYGQIYIISIGSTSYVGQALDSAFGRWSTHYRNLRIGRHHSITLQRAYNEVGLSGVTFRVLMDKVPHHLLSVEECRLSNEHGSINALPGKFVRDALAQDVLSDIAAGLKYRAIAKTRGIALGTISWIRQRASTA